MANMFKTPKLEAATKMPDSEDPKILAERRKKIAEQRSRGGRESTIMTEQLVGSTGKLGA